MSLSIELVMRHIYKDGITETPLVIIKLQTVQIESANDAKSVDIELIS